MGCFFLNYFSLFVNFFFWEAIWREAGRGLMAAFFLIFFFLVFFSLHGVDRWDDWCVCVCVCVYQRSKKFY